jgi:hypothetical protein
VIAAVAAAPLAGCSSPKGSVTSEQLSYRAGQSSTLLAELPPAETGIDFENTLDPDTLNRYLFRGAGVAAGDVDADGLPDVYLVGEETPNRLYRNLGGFEFEEITQPAGLPVERAEGYGAGAAMADVDNDGDLDLFATEWGASNRLYLNNGNGTFVDGTREAGLEYVGGSDTAAFGDYDRARDHDR